MYMFMRCLLPHITDDPTSRKKLKYTQKQRNISTRNTYRKRTLDSYIRVNMRVVSVVKELVSLWLESLIQHTLQGVDSPSLDLMLPSRLQVDDYFLFH
jgi:hypothetical protein